MATPNLGLTIPIGGTTPGALNNTTAGTYPYIESANLNLIDSLCYSSNNKVPTAGININADLTFNGFNLLDALSGTFAGTVTAGVLSVTGASTLSGQLNVGGPIVEATSATGLTLKGNAAASGTAVITDNVTANTSGTVLSIKSGGIEQDSFDYAGNLNLGTLSGIVTKNPKINFNGAASSTAQQGVISLGTTGGFVYNAAGASHIWQIGGTPYAAVTSTKLEVTNGVLGLYQLATTALTLSGNTSATGGPSVILDNVTAATSGAVLSVRSGGAEVLQVDYLGNVQLTGGSQINVSTSSTGLYLKGHAAATAGVAVSVDNAVTMTSGTIFQWKNNNSIKGLIDYAGQLSSTHLGGYSGATAPTGTSIPSDFGVPTVNGTDVHGTIQIVCTGTTGTGTGNLWQLTFGVAYGTKATALVWPANAATAAAFGNSAQPYVVTSTTQIDFNLGASVTPSSTTYLWNYLVLGY